MVEWQTRTLEVRMLTRLAGSTPVLGIVHASKRHGSPSSFAERRVPDFRCDLLAVGSGVERFLDTEEVIGSNPIPPINRPGQDHSFRRFHYQNAFVHSRTGAIFVGCQLIDPVN